MKKRIFKEKEGNILQYIYIGEGYTVFIALFNDFIFRLDFILYDMWVSVYVLII